MVGVIKKGGETMQRTDFNWFLNNYDELYNKYGHKFLVIKNKTVLGAYDNVRQALDATSEPIGTFIVQECNGNESAYTNYVASAYITQYG